MKRKLFTKILGSIIIISFILPSVLIPHKANALLGVGDIVYDPTNHAQNVVNTGLLTTLVAQGTVKEVRESILNGLAWMFAKLIVQQLTASVVNWINSGFEGSPAFVQNPGAFFLDVADQFTGAFISGELTQLCSPFSIDVRVALSFKYHPKAQARYRCTLGTIIQNSKYAIKNASINGFTAGDFRQGGWPAFVALTTEPQNNIYGAYLQADSDISIGVANVQGEKRDQLAQGGGFLSWEKCTAVVHVSDDTGDTGPTAGTTIIDDSGDTGPTAGEKRCEVQTPGSVISNFLKKQLDAPTDQLNLADSINEIVGALFTQLVSQVLTKGLGAVSGNGPSDSGSYINQIRNEVNGTNVQINTIGSKLIAQVDNVMRPALEYQANKDASLNLFISVKTSYEAAKNCYAQKLSNAHQYDQMNFLFYQSEINDIDSTLSRINLISQKLLTSTQEADNRVETLQNIKTAASTAKTLGDLNIPSQQLTALVQSGNVIGEKEVADSKKEYNDMKTEFTKLELDARRKLQRCQATN